MKKEIRIDELRVMMLDALALRGIGSAFLSAISGVSFIKRSYTSKNSTTP